MDVRLYREDEQFTFTSTAYMEYCSSDSTSFTVDQNEDPDDIFEEIRPMRQPPTELFEWHSDTNEKQLHGLGEHEASLPSVSDDPHDFLADQNWGHVWHQKQNFKQEPKETYISEQHLQLATYEPEPHQHISEMFNDFKFPSANIDRMIKSECASGQIIRRDSYRTESESSDILNSSTELTNFDITEYVFEEHKQAKKSIKVEPKCERVVPAGKKKIDLKAQKYIIEKGEKSCAEDSEGDVDIETVSEGEEESSPVLKAGDLKDLLEQFEATEVTNVEQNRSQNMTLNIKVEIKDEPLVVKQIVEKPKVESKQNMEIKQPMKIKQVKIEPKVIKPKPEQKPAPLEQLYINDRMVVQKSPLSTSNRSSNRQILASLPQELINRIKESSTSVKRKPITVIQPIPNQKKKCKLEKQQQQQEPKVEAEAVPLVSCATVYLDHNYCSIAKPPPPPLVLSKNKDSGFVSSEEDDRGAAIISRQPTVKNADGTLMVSLLKANTIRKIEPNKGQKKKLNLEEYKKRRNGIATPMTLSQDCSPSSSSCPSPNHEEDEHRKMLRHQEKLRRMAEEVLNAAPKGLPENPTSKPSAGQIAGAVVRVAAALPKVPDNLERKVFVSFGVNTDFKAKKKRTEEDPLGPVVKLHEMRPLLERASDKINGSSLISSVIETIPKVLEKNEKENRERPMEGDDIHGEYKQVVYLEKDRPRCKTREAETQTDISLIEQRRRGRIRRRRMTSSSSSGSSEAGSRRSRNGSDSSASSGSSASSSRSSSTGSECSSRASSRLSYGMSRSRSLSSGRTRTRPRRRTRRSSTAEREHMNAVEERRIIYVGKIKTGTGKDDLRRKFDRFGIITRVSLHFREIGDSYGFVTFKQKEAAHNAYEHGNDDASFPEYKISFGGRREFCKAAYSDLDNVRDDGYYRSQSARDSYDQLLQEALEKLKKRKV